jgi:hypothetical protein
MGVWSVCCRVKGIDRFEGGRRGGCGIQIGFGAKNFHCQKPFPVVIVISRERFQNPLDC